MNAKTINEVDMNPDESGTREGAVLKVLACLVAISALAYQQFWYPRSALTDSGIALIEATCLDTQGCVRVSLESDPNGLAALGDGTLVRVHADRRLTEAGRARLRASAEKAATAPEKIRLVVDAGTAASDRR